MTRVANQGEEREGRDVGERIEMGKSVLERTTRGILDNSGNVRRERAASHRKIHGIFFSSRSW